VEVSIHARNASTNDLHSVDVTVQSIIELPEDLEGIGGSIKGPIAGKLCVFSSVTVRFMVRIFNQLRCVAEMAWKRAVWEPEWISISTDRHYRSRVLIMSEKNRRFRHKTPKIRGHKTRV